MTAVPTPEQVAAWWRILHEHQDHGRCRAWADAYAELIAHDVFHLGPPQPTTGRNQRPADSHLGAQPMNQLTWTTLRCDNSGPNCPEIATDGDMVYLRDTEHPEGVAKFPAASFETLRQKILDGEI